SLHAPHSACLLRVGIAPCRSSRGTVGNATNGRPERQLRETEITVGMGDRAVRELPVSQPHFLERWTQDDTGTEVAPTANPQHELRPPFGLENVCPVRLLPESDHTEHRSLLPRLLRVGQNRLLVPCEMPAYAKPQPHPNCRLSQGEYLHRR